MRHPRISYAVELDHKCAAGEKRGEFRLYATVWPPQVVVCTSCQAVLFLRNYNEETQSCTFRTKKN